MKKVANCFMSLGSLSRARAIIYSVMFKNSCRVVLIALMMLCGSGSVFAQLATGDTITIRYNGSNNYLAVYNNNSLTYYSGDKPTVECLWIVTINGSDYSFESVSLKNKNVTNRKLHGQDGTTLLLGGTGSTFGLGTNGNVTNVANQVTGRFYYPYTQYWNTRYRFIQYNDGWSLTDYRPNRYSNNYTDSSAPNNTLLLLEKWTRKVVPGGLSGEFTSIGDPFGLATTDRRETKPVQFTITRTAAEDYLYCVNRPTVKIVQSASVDPSTIELEYINFVWSSSNNAISKTTCANYEDETVMSRDLLQLSYAENTTKDNNTWDVTVTALGSSPMDLKNGDGDWINYTDNIVASFREKNDADETTLKAYADVTREAYHRNIWPSFVVNASPASYTFGKEADTATIALSCSHQHGADIMKSDDATRAGEEYTINKTDVTLNTNISFVAKNASDETLVDWLTVSYEEGELTISATDNSLNGVKRYARLVGTCTYTNPGDPTDTHTEIIEIPITQNVKDGTIAFIPQKGFANTVFGKNPYTGEDEQLVHTAEKTIYYLPNENITLRLAEDAFDAYYRWYDYQTGSNPQYNAIGTDRTTWATQPAGTLINNTNGDTYGIYHTGAEGSTPEIKGWADGKAHIIACDVSNYTDYNITEDTIIEPTLSYRQLFHLRPASEMAERFKAAAANEKFVEYHNYMAPINQTIYLTTDYRYAGGDGPDRSYFYYTNGTDATGGYRCVGRNSITAEWFEVDTTNNTYKNITPKEYTAKDFLSLKDSITGTKVYELGVDVNDNGKIDDGDVRIARFVVNFVDDCGPSTTELISREKILADYVLLEEIDFNFGYPAPGNTTKSLNYHLPWEEASYGYVYPNVEGVPGRDITSGGSKFIPYWGEYYLTNKITYSYSVNWVYTTENHGGAANGYALYVDGTSEPGLVASISTDAVICSGQTLYCSVWFNNLSRHSTLPVFRCNIQGRNKVAGAYTEWEDVGVFFVGAMEGGNKGWKQVNFPILSDTESFDETRVSIYNFAASASGNDFMIDDIRLYVSPLPMAAYQATMGCQSFADDATTSTAVVVRIDYTQLNKDLQGQYAYYQIYNNTDNKVVKLKTQQEVDGVLTAVSAYYAENTKNISDEYGSIQIPAVDFSPEEGGTHNIQTSIQTYIESLISTETRNGKCYVKDKSTGKWYLYVIHIVPNTQDNVYGTEEDLYLVKDKEYQLVITHDPGEFTEPACASTTPLYATQDTYIELRNEQVGEMRVDCQDLLCANNHHFLVAKVQNTLATNIGGALQTIEATVNADWLIGGAFDDPFCNPHSMTNDDKTTADANFESTYGCKRNRLRQAIVEMRRVPTESNPNPNYSVSDPEQLQVCGDFGEDDKKLIQDLCAENKLKLYQTSTMFYMGSAEVVRYWVYPVAENAKVELNGKEYTLFDCDEPKWVKLTSAESEYMVNLAPIVKEDQTLQQRLDLPAIRIIEGTEQVVIPIKEVAATTDVHSTISPLEKEIIFHYNEPIENVLEYVDLSKSQIDIVDAPATLEPGKEYLMRMAFYDDNGNVYIGGDENNCRVGYIYFYLTIVPKTVQWTGEASAIWGDDANWKARKADGTLMDVGFAPLPETNVIIPVMPEDKPYPIVTKEDKYPLDVNYKSNTCNRIYFANGATILNQHLLEYKKAFVDMLVPATEWSTMAAPLKGMYTGDIYIPHDKNDFTDNTNKESNDPFVVSSFQGARTSSAPYAFWQSFYNKRVYTQHVNGNQSSALSTKTAAFEPSNSLAQALTPGMGFQVLGYGPKSTSDEILIVRLPKPDDRYYYYYNNGNQSDQQVSVSHSSELAFEPDANGNMKITLQNDQASVDFMFGNPTMAYIDMAKFLEANESVLEGAYYTMTSGTWNAEEKAITTPHNGGLLAPMRSVLVKAKSSSNKIVVTLSASHLRYSDGTVPSTNDIASLAPKRKTEKTSANIMTIYANNEYGQARCMLADHPYADNQYTSEEDVLFISSGIEEEVIDGTAYSPINMYTVSKQVPMMVDVRVNIDTVPVSMLVHDSYRTDKVKFAFYLSLNWDKECYFWDSKTDKKFRILDGLWLEMDMPDNHEPRYFIIGPDMRSDNDDNVTTSTTNPSKPEMGAEINIWAYSPEQGKMVVTSNDIIKAVNIYDPSGRLIAQKTLDLQYNSTAVNIPAGVYIVEATMRDNSKQYTQTVVW